jgi:hypothetical protein
MTRFTDRLTPLITAMLLSAAPLAAQAPPTLPPASPPPTAPVVAPIPAPLPVTRISPDPAAVAPSLRAAETAPIVVPQIQTPPAGATMRCKDGTWLFGAPSAARCDRNGGLATILPVRAAPPPAPPRAP